MRKSRKTAIVAAATVAAALAATWTIVHLRGQGVDEVALLQAEGGRTNVLDLLPRPLGRKPGEAVELLAPAQFQWRDPNSPAYGTSVAFDDANAAEAAKPFAALEEYSTWRGFEYGLVGLTFDPGSRSTPTPKRNDAWFPCLGTLVSDHKAFIDFIRGAADGHPAMFSTDWTQGPGIILSHLSYLRSASRLLSADAAAKLHQGDSAGAVEDVRTMLNLRLLVDDEPAVISKRVAMALDATAFSTLMMILREGRPGRAGLEGILATLEGREKRNSFAPVLLGETGIAFDYYRLARKDPGTLEYATGGAYPTLSDPYSRKAARGIRWFFWNSNADLQQYLEAARKIRARSRLGYPDILDGLPPYTPGVTPPPKPSLRMAPHLIAWLPNAFWEQARGDTWLRTTRVTLALYLYHADTGAYPVTLDELIPKYLKEPQIDAYTGKPLIYRQIESGYLLYSVGEDRKDDGGNPAADVLWQCDAPEPTVKPHGQ